MDSDAVTHMKLKRFTDVYINFIDDLNLVYNKNNKKIRVKRTRDDLNDRFKTQKRWVFSKLRKRDISIVSNINKNLEKYSSEITALDKSIFDPECDKCLRFGRIDFNILSKVLPYDQLTDNNKTTIWKYLNTILVTSRLFMKHCENTDEITSLVSNIRNLQNVPRTADVDQMTPEQRQQLGQMQNMPGMQNMMGMMQSPEMQNMASQLFENDAFKSMFSSIESKMMKQFQEKGLTEEDMKNPHKLFSMAQSGEFNVESIMNDLKEDIEKNINSLDAQTARIIKECNSTSLQTKLLKHI